MSTVARSFSALLTLAVTVSTLSQSVVAQSTYPPTALASKHFAYPTGIPYKVDTDQGLIRGTQYGYNICNSTTENQQSLCQTSFVNAVDDFCVWAPDKPDSLVANTEGEMVAWCTKPGRGTRLIPSGALKGIQFMRTPDYVQVIGFVDQTKINIATGDSGGEMDPHGADLRGNPMGGLMYSNAFSGGGNNFQQVIEWHNFMGGDAFCIKVCDPAGPNAAHFCEHVFDRIGCAYNAPNNAQTGAFLACLGDNQDYPGVYTTNGVVMTYTQPPESLGAIATMPYQPKVPASSQCTTYTSSVLYSALANVGGGSGSGTLAPTATPTGSGASASGTSKPTTSRTSAAAGSTSTGNDAQTIAASGLVTVLGVLFSAMFFA